jgi:hypothetical protein
MTANELAERLEHGYPSAERKQAAAMLREQAAEIERLKEVNVEHPLDDESIGGLIEAAGIEVDDDNVLEEQTIYYVDASALLGLVRIVEKTLQIRLNISDEKNKALHAENQKLRSALEEVIKAINGPEANKIARTALGAAAREGEVEPI